MKLIYLLALVFIPSAIFGQFKYDYHWTIGYDTSLLDPGGDMILMDFNQDPISVQTVKTVDNFLSLGSVSTMSDSQGKLIFYTSGCYVVDAAHEIMENGDSINPGVIEQYYCPYGYSPNPGGAISIPWPDSPNLFLLFISDLERTDFPNGPVGWTTPRHLYYNVIDLNKNAGLGKVIQKNQIAMQDTMARASIEACRHANGRDWWVMTPKSRSNCYFILLVTSEGVQAPIQICTGNEWIGDSGQACFTPDGTKFIRVEKGVGLHLYNFDNATGTLSYNSLIVPKEDFSTASVGASVSPNSRYLYVSLLDKLFQYDLQASDIPSSRVLLAVPDNVPDPFVPSVFSLSALAPDGKIYISSVSSHLSLHVIHRPDCPGLYSLPERRGLALSSWNYYSVPNMPNFRNEPSSSPCDSMVVQTYTPVDGNKDVVVFPNPASDAVMVYVNHPLLKHSKWMLYDPLGRVVRQIELDYQLEEYSVDLDGLSAGLYFYGIVSDGRVVQEGKLVLQR